MQNILLSERLDFQAGSQSKKGEEDDKMTRNSKSKVTLQICLLKRLDTPEKGILNFEPKRFLFLFFHLMLVSFGIFFSLFFSVF